MQWRRARFPPKPRLSWITSEYQHFRVSELVKSQDMFLSSMRPYVEIIISIAPRGDQTYWGDVSLAEVFLQGLSVRTQAKI